MKTAPINDIQFFLKSINEEVSEEGIKNIQEFLNTIPDTIPEDILKEEAEIGRNKNRLKELSKFYEKYVKISKECYFQGKGKKEELDELLMKVKYRVFAELIKEIFIHNNSGNTIKDLNKRWNFWNCKIKYLRELNNILEDKNENKEKITSSATKKTQKPLVKK